MTKETNHVNHVLKAIGFCGMMMILSGLNFTAILSKRSPTGQQREHCQVVFRLARPLYG